MHMHLHVYGGLHMLTHAFISHKYYSVFCAGGADVAYIRNLTSLNVSMSLATFMKLDGAVAAVSTETHYTSCHLFSSISLWI